MFRHQSPAGRPALHTPRRPVRPQLEALEDRSVPASVADFSQVGLAVVTTNPVLFNANALLSNQLADNFALIPTFASVAANQQLFFTVGNGFQQASFSGDPNAPQEASLLLTEEVFLARDIASIAINPGLVTDPEFVSSIGTLARAINANPWFFTPAGFNQGLAAAAIGVNQQLFGLVNFGSFG